MSKNIGKNVSSKYSQKTLYHAKKSVTDVLKTTSKIVIQKTAEATDNLIGNKTEKIIQHRIAMRIIRKHLKN